MAVRTGRRSGVSDGVDRGGSVGPQAKSSVRLVGCWGGKGGVAHQVCSGFPLVLQ